MKYRKFAIQFVLFVVLTAMAAIGLVNCGSSSSTGQVQIKVRSA